MGKHDIRFINSVINALRLKASQQMSLKSKLNISDKGIFAAFLFYTIAGILFLTLLPLSNFASHLGIIGILSLATAYGLFQKRTWSIWTIAILFLVATSFSAYTIYWFFGKDLLYLIGAMAYLALTWIFTIYAANKRSTLST